MLEQTELCRGFVAELRKVNVASKTGFLEVCKVGMVGVPDAKDTFNRLTQDRGFGTQKSRSAWLH